MREARTDLIFEALGTFWWLATRAQLATQIDEALTAREKANAELAAKLQLAQYGMPLPPATSGDFERGVEEGRRKLLEEGYSRPSPEQIAALKKVGLHPGVHSTADFCKLPSETQVARARAHLDEGITRAIPKLTKNKRGANLKSRKPRK